MDTKHEIITKAEQLFLKFGIRSVTMDDICRELGMSKKTLYLHFEKKNELVKSVIESHVAREQIRIQSIVSAAKDALDELKRMSQFVLQDIEDVSPSAVYDLQKYYRRSFDILMKDQNEYIQACFTSNIERGIKEGLFRKELQPSIVAKIYSKTSLFILDELADSRTKISRKELIHELYNYHVHGIATPKGLALWNQYNSAD